MFWGEATRSQPLWGVFCRKVKKDAAMQFRDGLYGHIDSAYTHLGMILLGKVKPTHNLLGLQGQDLWEWFLAWFLHILPDAHVAHALLTRGSVGEGWACKTVLVVLRIQRFLPWRKKSCAATAQLLSRLMVTCWMAKLFRCVEASALRHEGKQRHNVKQTLSRTVGLLTLQPCSQLKGCIAHHSTGMCCSYLDRGDVAQSWMVLYYIVCIRCSASLLSKLSERWGQVGRATRKVKQSITDRFIDS